MTPRDNPHPGQTGAFVGLIGRSCAMQKLCSDIRKVAALAVPVLLLGESGTGKEVVARALHASGPRREQAYVPMNAAAVPASLAESEFFGHEPGAFTGADRRARRGKFELADGGTLFLDEVGDMPLDIQVKLLRVLEDGRFERLGGSRCLQSDVRLVCATHRDLSQALHDGRFRHDLYYRISAVTIRIPPLRERLDDIEDLAHHFLESFTRRNGLSRRALDPGFIDHLRRIPWPGNVRQLRHEVEYAAIFAEGGTLRPWDLPRRVAPAGMLPIEAREDFPRACQVEMQMIRGAISAFDGNKKRAAEALGISRSHLYRRLADPGHQAVVPEAK